MKIKSGPASEAQTVNGGQKHATLCGMYQFTLHWLPSYVQESYRLSACQRSPADAEISAHRGLLMCKKLQVANFSILADYMEKGTTLRTTRRLNADTEDFGHSSVEASFEQLLYLCNQKRASAEELASLFCLLSPYTQANGRCSRALWMWRMARGSDEERAQLQFHPASELWTQKKAWVLHA